MPVQLTPEQQRLKERWAHYKASPADYVQDIILKPRNDGTKLLPYQADILEAIVKYDRVGFKAGNGVGKDMISACAAEWFLMTHEFSRVPVTSGTIRQLKEVFFSEVHKYSSRSLMAPFMKLMDMAVRVKGAEKEWFSLGFAAKEESGEQVGEAKVEGFHAENMLWILTEAKAVPSHVWAAVRKSCTGKNNRIFAQSVPGTEYGEFHKIFTKFREEWALYSFASARKLPDELGGGYIPNTPIVSQKSVNEKLAEGEDSPLFQASVLAEFVKQADSCLIALDWIRRAIGGEISIADQEPIYLGVDVARFGDDKTVIVIRKGNAIVEIRKFQGQDTMKTADETSKLFKAFGARAVYVDVPGVGGGVVDRLVQLGVNVVGVNTGEKARNEAKYANLRSEMWWHMREFLDPENPDPISLPDDEAMVSQLMAPRYEYVLNGKIQVESKRKIKDRTGSSPDEADAIALAFYNKIPTYRKGQKPKAKIPILPPGAIPIPKDSALARAGSSKWSRVECSDIMGVPK